MILTLFAQNQPYSEALTVPGDIVLEVVRQQLDESLSTLDDDRPRLARKQVEIELEFGSVAAFVAEALKDKRDAPGSATL